MYQKKVLGLLVEVRNELKDAQLASPAAHIERMATVDEFDKEEQRLITDKAAFDTLVGFTSVEYRTSALTHCWVPLGTVMYLCTYVLISTGEANSKNWWQDDQGLCPQGS